MLLLLDWLLMDTKEIVCGDVLVFHLKGPLPAHGPCQYLWRFLIHTLHAFYMEVMI